VSVGRVGDSGPRFQPRWQSADAPAPTVRTTPHGKRGGAGWVSDAPGGPRTRPAGRTAGTTSPGSKPPYRVRTVAETRLQKGGPTVVSTFSGAGGSCLGFRMAGFRVLWASEFIESARETYSANFPETPLDARDIRKVTAADVLEATGLEVGELDILEGSPPCASFSSAGKREKHWGKVKKYSEGSQRTDDLFFEYARLLRGLKPKVFVAENVAGLTKGVSKGWYLDVLDALRAAGYVVDARLCDAQWLGVPQTRQRVIFVGVRKDLKLKPAFPKPLPYRYSVRDAFVGLPAQALAVRTRDGRRSPALPAPTVQTHGNRKTRSELTLEGPSIGGYAVEREYDGLKQGGQSARYFNLIRANEHAPSPAITALGGANPGVASVTHPTEARKFSIAELKRICAFPDDFKLVGTYSQQWERLGRAVPPVMMSHIARTIADEILAKIRRKS